MGWDQAETGMEGDSGQLFGDDDDRIVDASGANPHPIQLQRPPTAPLSG